jgi:nitrate reductase NapE component
MKNFKITNLKSKVVQYMNESEKEQFFTKNSMGNYDFEDVQFIKNRAFNKKMENILFSIFTMAIFSILLLLMCGTFGFIDSLIF